MERACYSGLQSYSSTFLLSLLMLCQCWMIYKLMLAGKKNLPCLLSSAVQTVVNHYLQIFIAKCPYRIS